MAEDPATAATVAAALEQARRLGVDRLDAQLLLAHRLGRSRTWVIAHGDEALGAAPATAFAADCARRAAGEPLAYLVGEREFRGLALQVSPAVLVPRPETEQLVDWALELRAQGLGGSPAGSSAGESAASSTGESAGGLRLVDLGTGSGAIALALAREVPEAEVWATDASGAALAVAQANARRLGLSLQWRQGDWWAPLAGRRFALALSNPPYIAAGDPHLAALAHEPAAALSPGGDGLDALRAIVAGAPAHLEPGGWLLLEHGHDQGAAVRALLLAAGFEAVATRRDLAGHERCSGGRVKRTAPDARAGAGGRSID